MTREEYTKLLNKMTYQLVAEGIKGVEKETSILTFDRKHNDKTISFELDINKKCGRFFTPIDSNFLVSSYLVGEALCDAEKIKEIETSFINSLDNLYTKEPIQIKINQL